MYFSTRYKVGDRVRIVDKWAKGSPVNRNGLMDKWLGKTMTVRNIVGNGVYRMIEDDGEYGGSGWFWHEDMIAELDHNYTNPVEADATPTDELVGFFESITIVQGGV